VLLFTLRLVKADFGGTETSSNLPGRRLGASPCAGGRANGFGFGALGFTTGKGVGLDPDATGLENGFVLAFFLFVGSREAVEG
jgi:hypothetical protein